MKTERNADTGERLKKIERELQQIKQMLQQVLGEKAIASILPEQDNDIININQAMELLKLDRHILYAKCNNKDIPCFRVGKQYKFKRSELVEWQAAQKEVDDTKVDDYVTRYLSKNPVRG